MKQFLKKALQYWPMVFALALPLPVSAVQWDVGVGGDALWFDWREYRAGEELLAESGPLALGRADVRMQAADFYTSLGLAVGGGAAQYDGQLQDGTPYQSDAWEKVVETELQLGVQQHWGNVHVALLQRDWDRQIDGSATVSSVHEVYRWRLLILGGELQLARSAEWTTSFAVEAGVPVDSQQKVYSGFFGDFNLEPGDGYFWRLALPMRTGAWEFSPFLQSQSMDVSNKVRLTGADGLIYTVVQPESTRLEAGLRLRYALGGRAAANPPVDAPAAEPLPAVLP